MVDAGFENQKELTKMQLDNQKEIAEMQNETQKEIAGIQSATSRQQSLFESQDRKSGSAGMPRPISYAVFCLKKKTTICERRYGTKADKIDMTLAILTMR